MHIYFIARRRYSGNPAASFDTLKKIIFVALFALAYAAMEASAHTGLQSSSPAAGARMDSSPENLVLTFAMPVRLFRVTVETEAGETVDLGDYRRPEPDTEFHLSLPMLSASDYKVTWTVMGGDGHKMSGSFPFTIVGGHDH